MTPDEPEDEPPPESVTTQLRDAVERDEDESLAEDEGRDRHI